MSAKDAKNSFGLLIDYARAEPVQVEKHGRPVVVVVSVEEFRRLSERQKQHKKQHRERVADNVSVTGT